MPQPLTLRDVVADRHPGAAILTESQPVPVLGAVNLIAEFDDDTKARAAVQRLEGMSGDDARLGVVTFTPGGQDRPEVQRAARAHRTESAGEVDPEGVAGMAARRAAVGAVIAFVVTAVVVGVIVGLVTEQVAGGVAAGIGVGLLVAAIGGLLGAFSGFGTSDAWRQTFSPPGASLTVVALVDVDDADVADARERLGRDAVRLDLLDATGRTR